MELLWLELLWLELLWLELLWLELDPLELLWLELLWLELLWLELLWLELLWLELELLWLELELLWLELELLEIEDWLLLLEAEDWLMLDRELAGKNDPPGSMEHGPIFGQKKKSSWQHFSSKGSVSMTPGSTSLTVPSNCCHQLKSTPALKHEGSGIHVGKSKSVKLIAARV